MNIQHFTGIWAYSLTAGELCPCSVPPCCSAARARGWPLGWPSCNKNRTVRNSETMRIGGERRSSVSGQSATVHWRKWEPAFGSDAAQAGAIKTHLTTQERFWKFKWELTNVQAMMGSAQGPKAGFHVRRKHKHKLKHAFLFLALVLASSRFTRGLCLRLCRTCIKPAPGTLCNTDAETIDCSLVDKPVTALAFFPRPRSYRSV